MDYDEMRPDNWASYVGQARVKHSLDVAIGAAKAQKRPLGHVFLAAPAGSGKTSLASLIADQLGDPFDALSMAGLTPRAFAGFFRHYGGGVVLCDEIQAATRTVQEQFNTLLEQNFLTSPGGYRIDAGPWLTIVGATTEPERVQKAVRQKFEHSPRFDPYSDDEMRQIVLAMAAKAGADMTDELAATLGRAAGGVPRNARHLVLKARDLQLRNGRSVPAAEILDLAGVDADGVTVEHLAYLRALDGQQGIAGMQTLRMLLGMHETDIRDVERFLLDRGLIVYGERGRELTAAGSSRVRPDRPRRVRTAA